MAPSNKAIEAEASFGKWLLRLGPVGFIVGYSLTLTGTVFVLWNLLMACTNAGLTLTWKGPLDYKTDVLWALIYVCSVAYAAIQWFRQRQTQEQV
jgi:hypothetical protein